jgi:hypothetical protein
MSYNDHILTTLRVMLFLIDLEKDSPLIFAEISSEKIKKHFEETGAYPVAIDSPWNKPAIQMASDLFRSSSLFLESKYWWESANRLDPLMSSDTSSNDLVLSYDMDKCRKLMTYYCIRGNNFGEAVLQGVIYKLIERMEELRQSEIASESD